MANAAEAEKKGIEEISKIATESVLNIRTVASLRQEPHIIARYCAEISKVEKTIRKKLALRGLVNSTGQSIPFFGYSLALYYGGLLVANEGIHFKNIIKVSEALLYGTMMLGQSLAFAPAFAAGTFLLYSWLGREYNSGNFSIRGWSSFIPNSRSGISN